MQTEHQDNACQTNQHCAKCAAWESCSSPFQVGFSIETQEDGKRVGRQSMVPPENEAISKDGLILVIGDYPSEKADITGSLWHKAAEVRTVAKIFREEGLEDRLFYVPGFRCRSVGLNVDTGDVEEVAQKKTALKRCWTKHVKPFLQDRKIAAIVAMGPVGSYAAVGRLDYWTLVGRSYRYGEQEVPVHIVWHQNHVLMNPERLIPEWVDQLRGVAQKIASGSAFATQEDIDRRYLLAMRPEQIHDWFAGIDARRWPVSWDIESRGLQMFRPGFRVGVLSFDHPDQELPMIVVTDFKDAPKLFAKNCPDLIEKGVTWDAQKELLKEAIRGYLEDEEVGKIGHNCVDDQTEVLTPSGWVKFPDLADGQSIMQWENGNLSFIVPSHVIRKRYSGPLHVYDSWFHQGAYTPDHRMVVSRIRRHKGGTSLAGWKFKTAREVSEWHPNASYIPTGGGFDGGGLGVPDQWLRLAEAVRADGSIEKGKYIRFKFKRERKFIQLITLLNETDQGFSTSFRKGTWRVSLKKPDSDAVKFILGLFRDGKRLGPWVWKMTPREKEIWLTEALVWDGCSSNRSLFSADPEENEWFQIMAHTSGYRYPHRQRDNARGFNEGKTHREFLAHSAALAKTVSAKTGEYDEVHYDGMVYCVTVPSGAFLIRRNGVVNVTGNCHFDENAVFAAYGWNVRGFVGDTMMWQWAVNPDEEGFLGLEALVRLYFPDIPEYWAELDKWKADNAEQLGEEVNDYTSIPESIILPYAAYDTRVVTRLFKKLLKRIKKADSGLFVIRSDEASDDENWTDSMRETYSLSEYLLHVRKLHHRLCVDLHRTGQNIDHELLDPVYSQYSKQRDELVAKLEAEQDLRDFEKNELHKYIGKSSDQAKKVRRGEEIKINWASVNQQRGFFISFLKLPVLKKTDTGQPCLDEQTIGDYANTAWIREQDGSLRAITKEDDSSGQNVYHCEAARLLRDYRKTDKFITSFLTPIINRTIIHGDDMVHSEYRSSGIATGRLGAKKPNVQAIPRDGLVKKLYRALPGHQWVVTRDYSGLEVRILALFCRDPLLLKTFKEGGDVHFLTQTHFFGSAADKKNKTQRSICKQALFGNIYGQGDQGLYDLLTENRVINPKTGEPVTLKECGEFNQMIYDLYKGVGKWVEDSHRSGIHNQWVASAFGFVRRLPEFVDYDYYMELRQKPYRERPRSFRLLGSKISKAKRRAQNTSIQSTASDLTVIASCRINEAYREAGLSSRIFNVIHDDIWTSVKDKDEVVETVRIKAWYMDNVKLWIEDYLPGYDSSWMGDIPIIGECDIGLNPKDAFSVVGEPAWDRSNDDVIVKLGEEKKNFITDYEEIEEAAKLRRFIIS